MFKKIKIDRNSGKPVSEQIAAHLKSMIYAKKLPPGDKFPTSEEMMKGFGVGTNTLRQAIHSLKEEGLVRPVPRLGTIVNELPDDHGAKGATANQQAKQQIDQQKMKHVAVVGLMTGLSGGQQRFRPELANGIISEMHRMGVALTVLDDTVAELSGQLLYDRLSQLGCEGLIYAGRFSPNDEKIDYLVEHGIYAITSRRFRHKDSLAAVESDFDTAGYEVGLYFYAQGCGKALVLSHYPLTATVAEAVAGSFPLGIKHGLYRAFEIKGLSPDIDFVVNRAECVQTSKNILAKLETIKKETGVVFTNGYQFLDLFKAFPAEAKRLLIDKKVTIISNATINVALEKHLVGMDVMVLLDRFKEVGEKMATMLMGMVEGYVPRNTTTLAEVKLVPFNQI